jgi:exosortase family protein XrtM
MKVMDPLLSARGVPYLPDEGQAALAPRPRQISVVAHVLAFMSVFICLQLLWDAVRHTSAERVLIEFLLVKPAAVILNLITPQANVVANGPLLTTATGGLKIVSECTGTEVYFLLTAALCVFPMPWRARMGGILLGMAFVYTLNHARILALFYAHGANLTLFDLLHGIFLPVALVACTFLYFVWWTGRHAARAAADQRTLG